MLQIVIWGMAAMLVVKGLDVLHQKSIAVAAGTPGSSSLANSSAYIAFVSAAVLVWLSVQQSSQAPQNPFAAGMTGSSSVLSDGGGLDANLDADAVNAAAAVDAATDNAIAAIEAAATETKTDDPLPPIDNMQLSNDIDAVVAGRAK